MALDMIVDSADLNAGLTMIGDAIREKTGGEEALAFPNELAAGVGQVYDAGEAAEHARCVEKHFVTTILGNGQDSISFHIPFRPDVLRVFVSEVCMYGKYGRDDCVVSMLDLDLAGFGMIGGKFEVFYNSGSRGTLLSTTSIHNRFFQTEDGVMTLHNILDPTNTNSSGEQLQGIFANGREYVVIAVKYLEKTDKERITEYVRSLTGSGSVTLNRIKVNAAFTDAEWSALIAEKPSWTFSFI